MGRFNWGPEGAPEEAYERVTEPERFRPLHRWALDAVMLLEADYEVRREEGTGLDAELERSPVSRPTIRLTPLRDSAAPITIAFLDLPGLEVRFGRWETDVFPTCLCDACDEMADDQWERFEQAVSDAVDGRFRESLFVQGDGDGLRTAEMWSGFHRKSTGRTRVHRDQALRALNGEERIVLEWQPWPRKPVGLPAFHDLSPRLGDGHFPNGSQSRPMR